MRPSHSFHESFNEWAALARSDPPAFEALRREKVQLLIERAPLRRRSRLQALQWRIDQERDRAPSPLEACRRLSGMMWDREPGAGSNVLRFPPKR